MKKNLITVWLLLIAGVVGYSQKNTNQLDPNNITIDRENPCREFMMEVFPDKGNCSAQILNVYAWGIKENEQISWQLLDANKASKASGTFTATQTRNVNQRIELPNLPSGNYTFVATSTSCPKSPKEYSLHLQGLLQMSLLEKQDIGCNNKSSDKGSVLLRVSGGEKGSYIYGYEKIEEGHKPCGDSFDIRKPDYANDNIDGAPTYDGVPCWQKGTTNGNTFISLDEGIWRIYAMDPVRGCVVSDTVTIRRYPTPSISSIIPQPCNARTDAKVPVRITLAQLGQGKHYYQLNGESEQLIQFAENNTFLLNLLPNIYKIRIRDEKKCSADETFEVYKPIDATITFTAVSCGEFPAGFPISINVKGGKKAYNYTVTQLNTNEKPSSGDLKEGDNQVFIFSPKAGTYRFQIYDSETTNCPITKDIELKKNSPIQVSATPLYSKDCTQEKGEIALQISGGQAPYKVRLVNQVTKEELSQTLNSSVYTFTGVTAGNYTIEVQDAAGCSRYEGTTSVTVQPSFVLKNISFETLKKATCERKEEVLVKVAVTPEYVKGTWLKYIITSEDKKYRREIRLNDTTLHPNGAEALGVGKYHIEVLNEQTKCSITQDYEVKSVADDYTLVVGTPVKATCATDKGQLTLSVVPKEGTLAKISGFSYRLTAGSTVVTGTTTDNNTTLQLPAGFYQIEVTITETGCKLYDKVLMPEPPATIQVSATPLYSKDCTQENGEIALQISGGQAPYKVRLVNQVTKEELSQTLNSSVYTFTGVIAGNYTIEVQDTAGCSRYEGTTSVTVETSFVLKDISFETIKKATCERKEEVLVKVAVIPQYVKGTWLKYIITSEDKKYRREIRLNDTTLHLNGAEALGVGKYHIEVLNEQTKCSIGQDYEVKSVADDYSLVVGTPVRATCSSGKGLLTLSIQNKKASATKVSAFDYRITANSVVTGTSTNGSAMIRLSAGSYQIEVTVAETGCKLYGKVIMPEPPATLKLATTVQASANCEDTKGAAIVQVSGGVSPYTITLTHKRTGTVYSETNVGVGANAITLNFSDLKSGYYYAHVQDTAGCEAMGSVTIEEYTPIVLSKLNTEVIAPSCGDANDGKLIFEVQVSGGVPPYKYKLEKKTEKTSEHTLITVTNGKGSVENLSSGSYQLLVEDSKNCIATITETTIIAPKPITVDIKVNKSHSQACDDSQNGSVALSNIAGGSGFYRIYLINHEKKTVVDRRIGVKAGETVTFGNLASSYNIHYEIAIQDSKGCLLAHLAPFTIDEEPDVAVQSVENEINCDPTSNKGYVHTLVVKFNNNVVDYDKISYNLNNGTERSFTRTAGNIAFIDDFDAETLTQTLTVNYKPMGVGRPICPASTVNFSLTRFPQFTLERVPNDDLNVIEVIAKGGVTDALSGYTYYFNGENQGNNPVYTIKNTDPERIEAGGVRIKTIEVKAKDAKDCIRTLVVEVPYIDIDIPNYFTPNGDGDNDRWRPKKMEDFPNAFVHVFDRNGRRMATLKPGESWDGIYAGKPMPSGDYWYTIDLNDELRDGRKIYGHFSLYR
ncbi:T9SS type B sorting domain-containing protein [Capnocytophaga leadbetteri]|uniref:T9SS type B sorting domain-containing protein n=1 Tax=Capnocytophaga leadbetteri TaxID=327575 RepID=UPI0028D2A56C|nr:T9SS type B sorting domain-containing protein [Capnocytophaga leadbetteri]